MSHITPRVSKYDRIRDVVRRYRRRSTWGVEGNCLTFSISKTACRCTRTLMEWGEVRPGVGYWVLWKWGGPRPSALLRPVDVWEFTPSAGYTFVRRSHLNLDYIL